MKRPFLSFITLASFMVVGCQHLPFFRDPFDRPYPYEFRTMVNCPDLPVTVDFDSDGRDELISVLNQGKTSAPPSRILIYDHDFANERQVNFDGQVQRPTFFDWTNDGKKEIAIPFTKNDTTFLEIIDHNGNILVKGTPLFSGKARVDSTRTYSWQGDVLGIFYADLDRDSKKELIVFPNESYAQSPRGVFVYDGRTLELIWKYEIGPLIGGSPALLDVEGDGFLEIVVPSSAPNNGNSANGTDDAHSCLFLLDRQGNLIRRRDHGEIRSNVQARVVDVDGDGSKEIVAFFTDLYKRARLEILNPQTLLPVRTFAISSNQADFGIIQTDAQPDKEFIVSTPSELLVLNAHFQIIRARPHSFETAPLITVCPDLDNDGYDQILLEADRKVFCLDNNLSIKAVTSRHPSSIMGKIEVFHRRHGAPFLVLFEEKPFPERSKAVLAALMKNPGYVISYYGPPLGFLFGLAMLGFAFSAWTKLSREKQFYADFFEKSAALCEYPLMGVNSKMQIIFANAQARTWLSLQSENPIAISSIQNGTVGNELLDRLETSDQVRQVFDYKGNTHERTDFEVTAEPINVGIKRHSYWLVVFKNKTEAAETEKAKAWSGMAQRIAHDINNPLSSIQLTLQRLQMEYKDQDKSKAKLYDPYVERIMERIDALKRMSRGFMKLLNLEKINLQPANLNEKIDSFFSQDIIALPTDIHLIPKLNPNLPSIQVDHEQFQTLIENVVRNSVNAMPEGGTLSIATSLASELHFNGPSDQTRDYILIEIMDTGSGVPVELHDKLFKPFNSGTKHGTGLGLTIVKKVVDDHQGHIDFSSEEGVGTSFFVYLPVA